MKAITVTDPEYCMDSVAPGNFRAWAPILSGPLTQFFNTMTFDGDTSTVRNTARRKQNVLSTKSMDIKSEQTL